MSNKTISEVKREGFFSISEDLQYSPGEGDLFLEYQGPGGFCLGSISKTLLTGEWTATINLALVEDDDIKAHVHSGIRSDCIDRLWAIKDAVSWVCQ
ncbi:hypothetical protein I1H34_31800 (plasmid) [Acaryochloris marina S15]|nr:hypothetical protein I1H34_31800 [Acaryochloris marina S15]